MGHQPRHRLAHHLRREVDPLDRDERFPGNGEWFVRCLYLKLVVLRTLVKIICFLGDGLGRNEPKLTLKLRLVDSEARERDNPLMLREDGDNG